MTNTMSYRPVTNAGKCRVYVCVAGRGLLQVSHRPVHQIAHSELALSLRGPCFHPLQLPTLYLLICLV